MCVLCVCIYVHVHTSVNMELLRPQTPDKYLYNKKSKLLQSVVQVLFSVYQFDMMQTLLKSHMF